MRQLTVWTYLRGCVRYGAVAKSVGIDTLRVLSCQPRRELISQVVTGQLHGCEMEALLKEAAQRLPAEQREKFLADTRYDLAHISIISVGGMGITKEQLDQWLARRLQE